MKISEKNIILLFIQNNFLSTILLALQKFLIELIII
jgi:hypothetical protein